MKSTMEMTSSTMPITSRRRRLAGLVLAATLAATPARALDPPPVLFEGLGLGSFEGAGSVAAALRRVGTAPIDPIQPPVEFKGISVQGPGGRDALPGPLAAELRSRIDRFDVAAGMLADPASITAGPARWTGRIGMAHDRDRGSESLEVRTTLAPGPESSLIGVAVGPRVERRIGKGTTFFIDGQAEAQAVRGAAAGWWSLPGTSTADLTMLGVTARTGLVR
ncbi:MAG: hypothetical protein ACKO1M_01920 [Planctomycetota bacterium]